MRFNKINKNSFKSSCGTYKIYQIPNANINSMTQWCAERDWTSNDNLRFSIPYPKLICKGSLSQCRTACNNERKDIREMIAENKPFIFGPQAKRFAN